MNFSCINCKYYDEEHDVCTLTAEKGINVDSGCEDFKPIGYVEEE